MNRPTGRHYAAIVAAIVALAPVATSGQAPLNDGVDAFLRGDYAAAAATLRPLAEGPWERDHTAEFFMGILYDQGLGVAADPIRACSLYVRSSANDSTLYGSTPMPLRSAAVELIRIRQRTLDPGQFQECNWRATVGYDHQFDPVTISLGPSHSVGWDVKGATVSYQGVEKHKDFALASMGATFLPLRHTELMTGPARNERRHFIEIFKWAPYLEPRHWALSWMLVEVEREELIPIAHERVTSASGDAPPMSPDAARSLVQIVVNDRGEAEWIIDAAPTRRTAAIESILDRRERTRAAEQLQLRSAAEASIDYARIYDLVRAPTLTYPEWNVDGCGDIFVYGVSNDRAEAITVRIDRALLRNATAGSFDLATPRAGLEVAVHVYDRSIARARFCSDVVVPGGEEQGWRTAAGTMSVELIPGPLPGRPPFMYRATIRISDAAFVSSSGARAVQTQPIVLTAVVGWSSG
jgi:hypothetical protein